MRRWMHTCYSLVTNEGFSNFDSQITTLTRALALPCTWKVFLSWTNEQETSKRGGGDVFIHPIVKSNRYLPTQQKYALIGRAGRRDRTRRSNVTVKKLNNTAEWPNAPIRGDRTRLVVQEPYCTLTWRSLMSDQWWSNASGQQSTLLERDRTRPITS
jgi:hypothetical protein